MTQRPYMRRMTSRALSIFNCITTVRVDDGTEVKLSYTRFALILKELDEDLSRRVKALTRKLKPAKSAQE